MALVDTVITLFFLYSLLKLVEGWQGKTQQHVWESSQSTMAKASPYQWAKWIGAFALFLICGLLLEPVFILVALWNKLGEESIGFICLGVSVVGLMRFIRGAFQKPTGEIKADVIFPSIPRGFKMWGGSVRSFVIPIYLWYIFFVLLKIVPQKLF